MTLRCRSCIVQPTSETAKPDAATWLTDTSSGVNCETGWVAAAASAFSCWRAFHADHASTSSDDKATHTPTAHSQTQIDGNNNNPDPHRVKGTQPLTHEGDGHARAHMARPAISSSYKSHCISETIDGFHCSIGCCSRHFIQDG